jgi:putative transcriptional regulator
MLAQGEPIAAGDLLISPPQMPDPRFQQTVIMLTHHDQHGSYGLCLNKRTDHTVQDLLKDNPHSCDLALPLYWGGPVNPTTVWMLHSRDWHMPNTIEVNDSWGMTSNLLMFDLLAQQSSPDQFRVFVGFATWAADQLIQEIQGEPPWKHESSWLIWRQPHSEQILEVDPNDLWTVSMDQCARQAVSNWL